MRVTQSMLSNNMLRNLSTSYNKMGKIQEQITTGKKVNRPSDDPVVAMKGISYRSQLGKVEQFQRNMGEVHNWLDSSDDALDKVGQSLTRAKELVINAANGTLTDDDRDKIKSELSQLREHIQDLSNTKVGDKYIFSGTKTNTPLFDASKRGTTESGFIETQGFGKKVEIEVFDGIKLQVNTNGYDLFSSIDADFKDILEGSDFGAAISIIDDKIDKVLTTRSDIGAKQNRAELMESRLNSQEVTATKLMSSNEDIDYEKVITEMITQESVHRAALSVGSRIIQPTLVDFLR